MNKPIHVLYISDGEQTTIMPLADLIANFNANDGWRNFASAEAMREEIEGRGWFEGEHDFGHYIAIDVAKIGEASNISHYKF
jgi:hypothetical protein